MNGSTDRPIRNCGNDEFEISPYIEGLAEFIDECETPMTIAVQGDWGSGKTSMMNMVRDYLKQKGNMLDVWFNTWQFSQFNMDEKLSVTFLQHLIKELTGNLEKEGQKKELVGKFVPIIKNLSIGVTKQFVGADIGDALNEVLSSQADMVDEVSGLKEEFQELIRKVTENGKKRVVIFVDDLDRLQPIRAVELLEILKLFVDCENCVFVMAIDTSVVFQGIREKYGENMSDEKAQSFFDKMIQLPFKMPLAYYKIDNMIIRLMQFLQNDNLTEKEKQRYVKIIRKVSSGNPRSLKRMANSMLLLDKVLEKKHIYDGTNSAKRTKIQNILAMLECMQLKYEPAYNFIVETISNPRIEEIRALKAERGGNAASGDFVEQLNKIGMPKFEIWDLQTFYDLMVEFKQAIEDFMKLSQAENVDSISAKNELVKIIRMTEVAENFGEAASIVRDDYEPLQVESHTEKQSIVDATNIGLIYLGKIRMNRGREAYEELTEQKMYFPYGVFFEDNNWKKDECPIRIENFYLFQLIDEALTDYCGEPQKKTTRVEEQEIVVTYTIKTGGYAPYNVKFEYNGMHKTLKLFAGSVKEEMECFDEYMNFVAKLREKYQSLQDVYTVELLKNWENDVYIKYDDNDKIIKYTLQGFPIVTEELALFIREFFTKMAQHPSKLLDLEEKNWIARQNKVKEEGGIENPAIEKIMQAAFDIGQKG